MFIDASAIVAIMTGEEAAEQLAATIQDRSTCITSSISVWEAACAVSRKTEKSPERELSRVFTFLEFAKIKLVPDSPEVLRRAVDAFQRYGRRSDHPAKLNLGDCFSYAFARQFNVQLIYTGSDFALTDVNDSRPPALQ